MTANPEQAPPLWKSLGPVFLIWCLLLLAIRWTRITGYKMDDPDDFMRMVQVRSWIDGQSWFDVTQYRINLPEGASMHWSRYVDVPIRSMIELFSVFVSQPTAEIIAMTVVPLAILGLIFFAMYRAITALTGDWKTGAIGAAFIPTNLWVFIQILPMRVDHHSWQLAMAAVGLWAMVDRKLRWGPQLAGVAMAFWMHVSIEGLPYAVICGLIYGWFYVRERDRSLVPYSLSLTLATLFFLVTTRAPAELVLAFCDAVSWPVPLALGIVSAGLIVGDRLSFAVTANGRAISLSLIGAMGAAAFLGSGQSCALNPFGQLEPLVRQYWYETISEGLDVTYQRTLVVIVLFLIPAVGLAGIWQGWRQQSDATQKKRWLMMAMLAVLAFLMSLKVMRGAGVAELYATVGTAVLVRAVLDRIMRWEIAAVRVVASVVAIYAISPVNALVLANAFDPLVVDKGGKAQVIQTCNLEKLAAVPKMYIFTAAAIGPSVLLRTPHDVYSSGYHRSHANLNKIIKAFISDEATAKKIIMASGADAVMYCADLYDFENFIKAAPDGLAARLARGDAPDWLVPAPGMDANQLWKVKRAESVVSGKGR